MGSIKVLVFRFGLFNRYKAYLFEDIVKLAGFLALHYIQVQHLALILEIKTLLPGLNFAEEQREEHGKSPGGRREVKQGEVDGWGGEWQEKDKAWQGQV